VKFNEEYNPIDSKTIAERVADRLRGDILQKRIPEGSRITVKEIAQRYGAGLTPVRDAFQVLKSERLLEITPYTHARVLKLDKSFIKNVYDLVRQLECMMAEEQPWPWDRCSRVLKRKQASGPAAETGYHIRRKGCKHCPKK